MENRGFVLRSFGYAPNRLLELIALDRLFFRVIYKENEVAKAGWLLHIARELLQDLKNSLMNVTV